MNDIINRDPLDSNTVSKNIMYKILPIYPHIGHFKLYNEFVKKMELNNIVEVLKYKSTDF